jgi:hypothetical protein
VIPSATYATLNALKRAVESAADRVGLAKEDGCEDEIGEASAMFVRVNAAYERACAAAGQRPIAGLMVEHPCTLGVS